MEILKEMGIPDHLASILRNLCAGQEAIVRTEYGKIDGFQIRKEVHQSYILSPCLFNFYAEYIMRNARLDEAQVGVKTAGRYINNLRYADDTTLMAESKELKSLLMKVKEESEKVGLNSTFRKLRLWHLVPSLHGKQMGKQWQTLFFWAPKSLQMVIAAMKLKILLGWKVMTNLDSILKSRDITLST